MPKKSPNKKYRRRMDWIKVMETIHQLEDSFGYPPTCTEVAEVMESTSQNIYRAVLRLQKRGFVEYNPQKLRSLRVIRLG